MNRQLVLIAHNLRSCHNVGSLLRTADGLGLQKVFLTGYTPYPSHRDDKRLPHIARKLDRQIHKTALGAEQSVTWQHEEKLTTVLKHLRQDGFTVCALEQSPQAVKLSAYQPPQRVALLVGREVEGLEAEALSGTDAILEIPMLGQKESFNVTQAAAMALFYLRFM